MARATAPTRAVFLADRIDGDMVQEKQAHREERQTGPRRELYIMQQSRDAYITHPKSKPACRCFFSLTAPRPRDRCSLCMMLRGLRWPVTAIRHTILVGGSGVFPTIRLRCASGARALDVAYKKEPAVI